MSGLTAIESIFCDILGLFLRGGGGGRVLGCIPVHFKECTQNHG